MHAPHHSRAPAAAGAAAPALTVLGGGPCGLAHGYFAARSQIPFAIFEAADTPGGNCRTFEAAGGFRYDSGAHRLHGVHPWVTRLFEGLLGGDLREVSAPSLVREAGRDLTFPLTAPELLLHLGGRTFLREAWRVCSRRLRRRRPPQSFEELARTVYGDLVADRFLLNYSEKLWGERTDRLSPQVASRRLQGLDIKGLARSAFPLRDRAPRHLEGRFFYPALGIGQAMQALARGFTAAQLVTGAEVTAVHHDGRRIVAVQLNGRRLQPTPGLVVSTLPLPALVQRLAPPAPPRALALSAQLRYQSMRLVALFLDRPQIASAATVYFPDRAFPFTRVYEPRVRSPRMSPPGRTSLVAEVPCTPGSALWEAEDGWLIQRVVDELRALSWLQPGELLGAETRRLHDAYPILDLQSPRAVEGLQRYLGRFENLRLCGRNGRFAYRWIHDMVEQGRQTVRQLRRRG